ncbi:sulfite exporter TauE/SafE family protein [Roseomonas sp. USHLN139]|uniref:sulfite exporter TauE/SafE family protein n=1 Tax=Roseomonas sp. USHLN139 TaxID=3081298 RepID=UPI003B020B20
MQHDPGLILAIAAVFFVAGLVKGVIGLGLPTVAMGLLGLFLPPAEGAALMILPSLLTNFFQAATGGEAPRLLRKIWPLLLGLPLGAALGVWIGIGMASGGNLRLAQQGLGLALVLYGLFGLAERRLALPARGAGLIGAACGLVTGALTAATGVFVLPAVPWLQALGLERRALLQAMGLSFSVSTLALAESLGAGGDWGASALALVPTLLGMALGQRLNLPPVLFRRLFFCALLALGAHLLW